MSVNVTINIENNTADYIFFVGPWQDQDGSGQGQEISPGIPYGISFNYHEIIQENMATFSFDNFWKPTGYKTNGLGEGILSYAFDPFKEQFYFIVEMSPAPAGPQETPAPTFEVSGDINGTRQGSWDKGLQLTLSASAVTQITLSITE